MFCNADNDVYALENRRGFFSVESDEGFDKYLRCLSKEIQRFGFEASYMPTSLKFLVRKLQKQSRKK